MQRVMQQGLGSARCSASSDGLPTRGGFDPAARRIGMLLRDFEWPADGPNPIREAMATSAPAARVGHEMTPAPQVLFIQIPFWIR